jgi:hypothetical protein
VSLPLPAAVAAALVLAIGLALTATVASLPVGARDAFAPTVYPVGTLAVDPARPVAPDTATRSVTRPAPVV